MDWVDSIERAITFIERELGNPKLSPEFIAKHVHVSEAHFSRAFNIITGYTLSKYIRNRRLSTAGENLKNDNIAVFDAAINACYDSPEAFSKAFKRFHGFNPSESKTSKLEMFYPLQVKIILTQERPITFRIESKPQFFLSGNTELVSSDDSNDTKKLWIQASENGYLLSCFKFLGFENLVGVSTNAGYTIKAKCVLESENTNFIYPPHKWAIFSCEGEMPKAILEMWNKIYTTWLPKGEFEVADLPQLEVYFGARNGYSCEIWIPVK